jgi:hypothetical protein
MGRKTQGIVTDIDTQRYILWVRDGDLSRADGYDVWG